VRLAAAYLQREVRHEDQQKQPGSYQESRGEFHGQPSSSGSVQGQSQPWRQVALVVAQALPRGVAAHALG
jgi:hypothetical protein